MNINEFLLNGIVDYVCLNFSIMKTLKVCGLILVSLFFNLEICFSQKKMETYYDLGRTKIKERYFVNASGQKNGLYTKYDDRGIRGVEIPYTNGKPNGVAKEYYLPGYGFPGDERLKKSSTYVNGEQEGISVAYVYIKDGKEQLKEGVQTKAMEQYFHKDKLEREVQYFPNGKIAIDGYVTTGSHKEYYNNGTNKLIANLKNGYYEGAWKEWFENGNLALEGVKKDGKWFGEYKSYNVDGKPNSFITYTLGDYKGEIRQGYTKEYDSTGLLLYEYNWTPLVSENNKLFQKAHVIIYFPNNKIRQEYDVKRYETDNNSPRSYNDKYFLIDGTMKTFHSNGNLLSEAIWREDKITDQYKEYDETGKLIFTQLYRNGQKIGKTLMYFNKDWKEVDTKSEATIYREIYFNDNGSIDTSKQITDFWITGEKQWEGYLLGINPDCYIKRCVWYFKNGKIETEKIIKMVKRGNIPYCQNGDDFYHETKNYYENGSLKEEGLECLVYKAKEGSTRCNWQLIRRGKWKYYDERGKVTKTERYNDSGVLQ